MYIHGCIEYNSCAFKTQPTVHRNRERVLRTAPMSLKKSFVFKLVSAICEEHALQCCAVPVLCFVLALFPNHLFVRISM